MRQLMVHIFLLVSFVTFAQQKDKFLPKGNDEFAEKKYADAEADYRVSQSKSPKYAVASYNLGNSIYRQKQSAEAKYPYLKSIESAKTKPQKHKAFHNLGNVYMNEKNYQGAVEAYKNALRNDPTDEQTRYNFALAKKMLKDNPPPPDDKKDDKKDQKDDKKDDKKDPNKDKKDGDQKDKNQDPKDGDKDKKDKGQPKDDKSQGQPKPHPGDIPKERLENLLDAVNNEEKKVQDKVKAQKVKGRPVQTEKDW